jgi:hypothetical protein
MDASTIVMLVKIVSDLGIVISQGLPKVEGLTDDEKKVMLASLQKNTSELMALLIAMSAK